jgi:hypothetical protein
VHRAPPFLPFLSGPPRLAVGLRPIAPEAWLDPDTEIAAIGEKRALIMARRDEVYAQMPGSEDAQSEAAALIGALRSADVRTLPEAGLLVSDDLCVMQDVGAPRAAPTRRDAPGMTGAAAGSWRLTAALLCAPSHWSLRANIGGPLTHLHAPVPDRLGAEGQQGLPARIARVFDALATGVILERFNWTVQAGPERFAPLAAPLIARARAAAPEDAAALLHLRVERQTIRKLPASGAVLFTIRVCLDPLAAACADPAARAAFARAWREADAHVRAYKNWAPLDRLVDAFLAG